jgi:Uma2 family endonuclease
MTLTFEEFEQLPDEPGKMELLDGELVSLPPAEKTDSKIAHRLFRTLMPLVDESGAAPGLGELCMERGYKIGPRNWLQPDVSIEHADQPGDDYSEGAPALAVEVISKSNTAETVDYKVQTYLANGGIEVWVMYPKTRSTWVFRQGHSGEFRDVLRSEIIPGLRIDLGKLFA